jgi:hypothetical protein
MRTRRVCLSDRQVRCRHTHSYISVFPNFVSSILITFCACTAQWFTILYHINKHAYANTYYFESITYLSVSWGRKQRYSGIRDERWMSEFMRHYPRGSLNLNLNMSLERAHFLVYNDTQVEV